MKLAALIIIALSLIDIHVIGQRNLTKDEIFENWKLRCDNKINANVVVDSDSALNVRLTTIIDSLKGRNVDSLVIYSTAYPGYISTLKCDTGIFPIESFIIWNKDGLTHLLKLRGNCTSGFVKNSLHLFDFFAKKSQKLESEIFMPVILSGQLNKDGTVTYTSGWIDHEPNYSFYYSINGISNSFHFCQSYLDNTHSLFWNYNLSLSAYQWWKQVRREVDKIE